MAQFTKVGQTYFRQDDSGSLFAVSDPDTLKGLNVGQLPYNSVENTRGLSFSPAPTTEVPKQNTTAPATPVAPVQNEQTNTPDAFKKQLIDTLMNYKGVSDTSQLEVRRQELLRKQLLSAPYSEEGDKNLTAAGKLSLMRSKGSQYEPEIQSLEQQIAQAKQGDETAIANLQKISSIAKYLGMFGEDRDTSITEFGGNKVLVDNQTGDTIRVLGPADSSGSGSNANDLYNPLVGGGEPFLATLSQSDATLVKNIADYKLDLAKVTSLRSDERTRIAKLVAQYDPTFDMTQYPARAQVRKDFTSGKAAQNIRSLNTAVGHLDTLNTAADELKNASFTTWNAIKNYGFSKVGDPRVTKFKTAATAVESELAAVFKGTGATDQEIKVWRENLNSSQSPEQLDVAIDTAIELMGSRLYALQSQYETGLGKPKDFRFLNDKSRTILEKLGQDVNSLDSVNNSNYSEGNSNTQIMTGPEGTFEVPLDKVELYKQNGYN